MELVVCFFEMQAGELMKVYSFWIGVTFYAIWVRNLFGATFKILFHVFAFWGCYVQEIVSFLLTHAKLTIISLVEGD